MIAIVICTLGLIVGLYTFIRHLNALSASKTPVVDAWLVAVGSLAWSVALFDSLANLSDGVNHAHMLIYLLFLTYWLGMLLQIQKHCLKIKLRKRKLEKL